MSRSSFPGSPFFLGFEEIERLLELAGRNTPEAYPPLNIEQTPEDRIRITIAVAGFAPEQLSVSVCDREMIVKGDRPASGTAGKDKVFLHKGIATRAFTRSFALASDLEVVTARLSNGLLRIELQRVRKTREICQIPITID
ncbi:MAG: Hsp20 family protein [Micropepsaceae bacterium]